MKTKFMNVEINREALDSTLNTAKSKVKSINDKITAKDQVDNFNLSLLEIKAKNKGRYKPLHYQTLSDTNRNVKHFKRERNTGVVALSAGVIGTTIALSSATVMAKIAGIAATGAIAYKGLEYLNNKAEVTYLQNEIAIENSVLQNSLNKKRK